MNANELMIGDWVKHINGTPYQVTCIKDGHFACSIPHLWEYNNKFEPIPLTAEILEKNGFVEQEYGWRKLNAANWCIYINIFNGKERYALSVLGINTQVTLHGYYVHELQHALRLCGIEKQITI